MDLFENNFVLQKVFASLSLQSRESGLVDLVSMKWSDPSQSTTVKEFKDIYVSRIKKFQSRFPKIEFTEIATISKSQDGTRSLTSQITIRGVLKRLEFLRVRAFEKHYNQRYDGEHRIYDSLDEMEIEDETGKLKIVVTTQTIMDLPGNKKMALSELPSGAVLGMSGKFKPHSNKFIVRRIFLPQLPPQTKFTFNYKNKQGVSFSNKKILIASEPNQQTFARIRQTIFSSCSESANIVAVVIIGGFQLKVQSIRMMAEFVEEIKNYIDVFVMPSSNQDRKRIFPLQPYNGLYFIKSQTQIGLCSNPQLFQAENGLQIHVSCGQNVKDFMNNCSLAANQIEALESIVRLSHFCPTSPYSLKTQPYDEDYFVMQEIPHVMVAGKSKRFACKYAKFSTHKATLFVSVPSQGMGLVSLNGDWSKELL